MTHPHMPAMFHTGIIVDDLEKAMADYTAALGLTWAEPMPSSAPLRTPAGLLPRLSWVTFSLEGPHRIELIEHVDSTAWAAAQGGPRLHHVGYWVDDLPGEVARLEALGFRSEVRGETHDGRPQTMSYHLDPNGGLFLEVVDRALMSDLEAWWNGAAPSADRIARLRAQGIDVEQVRQAFRQRRSQTHPISRPSTT